MEKKFWHPYAQEWPEIEGNEWRVFKRSCKESKLREPILYRLLDGVKQYLDGRNRCRVAEELGIDWPEDEVKLTDAEVRQFIDDKNLHRRHLTKAQRKKIVCRMRKQGESIRTIASRVGVSKHTVQKDVSDLRTPEHVKGLDGKTYGTSNLLPEIANSGISPKFLPQVQELSKPRQRDFWGYFQAMGGDAKKALQKTLDQREPGLEPPPSAVLRTLPKWNQLDKIIKQVEALPDVIADCFQGVEKSCDEYRECQQGMAMFRRAWDRWRGRLTLAS